jgi:hypothetical protein
MQNVPANRQATIRHSRRIPDLRAIVARHRVISERFGISPRCGGIRPFGMRVILLHKPPR